MHSLGITPAPGGNEALRHGRHLSRLDVIQSQFQHGLLQWPGQAVHHVHLSFAALQADDRFRLQARTPGKILVQSELGQIAKLGVFHRHQREHRHERFERAKTLHRQSTGGEDAPQLPGHVRGQFLFECAAARQHANLHRSRNGLFLGEIHFQGERTGSAERLFDIGSQGIEVGAANVDGAIQIHRSGAGTRLPQQGS